MNSFLGFLRLMRLANIVTAISDILAGIAIAGFASTQQWISFPAGQVLLLVLSTIGLYGGGVVFNDVFDAELDKVERPERPIPSGLIKKSSAAMGATALLLMGILAAALVHPEGIQSVSAMLAILTALAAVVYDKWGKHHHWLGPLNMGLCRGLNLLLGISILPPLVMQFWYLALVPILYIAAITMISRGEVHGGSRNTLYGAIGLYSVVIVCILAAAFVHHSLRYALVFLLFFASMVYPPLVKALKEPSGPRIGRAVKAGVIGLIVMNAAWAAAFGSIYTAILIFLLLPLSIWLARAFAVT